MIKASLVYPPPGEVNIAPQTEMVIVFDEGYIDDVNIIINDEVAVEGGKTSKKFATISSVSHEGKVIWSLRKIGGLPSRDILVRAWTSERCRTIEQRFFVSGSEYREIFRPPKNKKNWCFTRSGVFFSKKTPFRDQINLEDLNIPEKYLKDAHFIDVGKRKDGIWRAVICNSDNTILAGNDVFQKYNFGVEFATVCHDMVNLATPLETLHLPLSYKPSSTEIGFSDWFSMPRHKKNVKFGNRLHVFWDNDEFITRLNPSPWTDSYDDMLWTKKDIKSEINKLEIVNENVIAINNFIAIEVQIPKVIKI